jgi:hypothetical protein
VVNLTAGQARYIYFFKYFPMSNLPSQAPAINEQTNNSLFPIKIGHQTEGTESHIKGDIRNHSVDEHEISINDSNSCIAIGQFPNGSTVSNQTNHVQENHGVTGITGTGHTINIYQYPKELIELLKKKL